MPDLIATLVESFDQGGPESGLNLLATPFMRNAFFVGTVAALAAGVVGYFVLLRALPFATHAIAHIGFPGATFAVLVGWPPVAGLVVACVVGAGAIGALSTRVKDREVVTGTVLAFASGLGILFNSLGPGQSGTVTSILFGNVLAVSTEQIIVFGAIVGICLAGIAATGRQLFFASIDPEVAAARGVRVSALGAWFLVLMSLVVAVAVTVVGVLLIFALLVTPAAAAVRITARPRSVVLLGVAFALISVWGGLAIAIFVPWPPSFLITSIACAIWLGATASSAILRRG